MSMRLWQHSFLDFPMVASQGIECRQCWVLTGATRDWYWDVGRGATDLADHCVGRHVLRSQMEVRVIA
jgi:hypothetical protein